MYAYVSALGELTASSSLPAVDGDCASLRVLQLLTGGVYVMQATERFKKRQIPGPKPYYATNEWPSLWFEPEEVWEASPQGCHPNISRFSGGPSSPLSYDLIGTCSCTLCSSGCVSGRACMGMLV